VVEQVRRAAKVDANQSIIVDALRLVGCSVLPLHAVGQGCPDLLVARNGETILIEVKDGAKPPSARKLTPDQVEFHATWRGKIVVACNVREAMEAVGISASGWVA
jgi:Holliday junction resolvase